MTFGETTASRYWLTPAGCAAAGGHRLNATATDCMTCGAAVETPTDNPNEENR
ncbi:MAG TPA: hypothetical protein VLI04_08130 [Nocardioidaceae bacterium]|nr:hypothetical protein [Nocardioidaceae bacterium]